MYFSLPLTRKRSLGAALAILVVVATLQGCPGPISDARKLRAIKAEAEALVAGLPDKPPRDQFGIVSKNYWPPAIATLEPHTLYVRPSGVHILTKPDFDGGWGYEIVRDRRDLGMPPECYWEMAEGVFWHGPC